MHSVRRKTVSILAITLVLSAGTAWGKDKKKRDPNATVSYTPMSLDSGYGPMDLNEPPTHERIILAAALAQEPRVLLLDEPTSSLDLAHQIELYRLLDELCRGGMMVVSVTHDLNLAAMFDGRIILLRDGRVAADGASPDVLRPEIISDVFGVRSEQHQLANGRSWITYGY